MGMGGILAGAIAGLGSGISGVAKIGMEDDVKRGQMREQSDLDKQKAIDIAKAQDEIQAAREERIRTRRAEIMGQVKGLQSTEAMKRAAELGADNDTIGVLDKAADNERQDGHYKDQREYQDKNLKLQERQVGISAANSARQNRVVDAQLDEIGRKKETEARQKGLIGGYLQMVATGDKEGAETYRRTLVAEGGKDPSGLGKGDPLSSQVAAAKAVLSDMDSSDEDKEMARGVLRSANQAYIGKKSGGKEPAPTKVINGQTYVKVPGGWQLQESK